MGVDVRAYRLRKGLDIPLSGQPRGGIAERLPTNTVGVLGSDSWNLKVKLQVSEGQQVARGDALFTDKTHPEIVYCAPGGGEVRYILRGARRSFAAVVIALDDEDSETCRRFQVYDRLEDLSPSEARAHLQTTGLWPALRERPFGRVPAPRSSPKSLFVTAMDTGPLAADPKEIMDLHREAFRDGLQVLRRLGDWPLHVCSAPGKSPDLPADTDGIHLHEFAGPHPAGLPGTHIHFIDPVLGGAPVVWHIGYQDVIAIGYTFRNGELWVDRWVALAGPQVQDPRIVVCRQGAALGDLVAGQLVDDATPCRVISGSVLSGQMRTKLRHHLGRFHTQVSVIRESGPREILGWLLPSRRKFSTARVHFNIPDRPRRITMDSQMNGSLRAMVPFGLYEEVMPMDLLPTQLLRALLVLDTDRAKELGALELDEEDLALCSYVDFSKHDFGEALRMCLHKIEVEG